MDSVGRITCTRDPEGGETWYDYDDNDYLTRADRVLSASPEKLWTVSMYVDGEGSITRSVIDNEDSGGTALSPATYTIDYTFDTLGAATRVIYDLDGVNHVTRQFVYDGLHRVTREIFGEGNTGDISYDERGLVYQETLCPSCAGGGTTLKTYYYDGVMRTTRLDYADSSRNDSYWDGLGNLTRGEDRDASGTLLAYRSYDYDDNGNRLTVTRYDASSTAVGKSGYCYDEINRCTPEKPHPISDGPFQRRGLATDRRVRWASTRRDSIR